MKYNFILFAFLIALAMTIPAVAGDGLLMPPITNATSGTAPFTVDFSCNPSGGNGVYTFSWNFGDGGTSTAQNPSHTYTVAGDFTAVVEVTSGDGQIQTCSQPIHVEWPNVNVTCTANPTSGDAPLLVNFTSTATGGSGSYTYSWVFGDGGTSTAQNPSHTYVTANTYTATVTVTSGGKTGQCSKMINVTAPNNPPSITGLNATPNPASGGDTVTITFTLTDPDGDSISWSAGLSENPACGGSLNPTSGGPVPSGTLVTIHYNTSMFCTTNATVTINANDGNGGTDQDSINIGVQ